MKRTALFMLPFFAVIAVVSISVFTPSCNFSLAPLFNDSLPVPPNVLSKKDSLAVRAILDANGLYTVKVRDVINLQNSIIAGINIDSTMNLTKFVFTNAFDSISNGSSLTISYSQIDTLIILDTIHQNFTLTIYHTKLQSIPDQIALFTGSITLYLPNNQLRNISPQILKCNVHYITVRYNHLVSVPDSIAALLTSKDGPWMNYQTP